VINTSSQLDLLLNQLKENPQAVAFHDVMAVIDQHFYFTPTAFTNGDVHNEAGQNNGSCKVFAFAKLYDLDPSQTLACFGDYYRCDVLQNPEGDDHQNIRNFMQHGWAGIVFLGESLQAKNG